MINKGRKTSGLAGKNTGFARAVAFTIAVFLFFAMPVHAYGSGFFAAGSFAFPRGPVFVGQPTFAAAAVRVPGPVIVNQPVFAAAAVRAPPLIVTQQPVFVSADIQRSALPAESRPVAVNVNAQPVQPPFEQRPIIISANADVRAPAPAIPQESARFVAIANFNAPPLAIGEAMPVSVNVNINANQIQPVIESTPVSVSVNVNANMPQANFGPTQLPSIVVATNFQPNFGAAQAPAVSLSIQRREIPTAEIEGRIALRLRNLDEDFPLPCDCDCGCPDA